MPLLEAKYYEVERGNMLRVRKESSGMVSDQNSGWQEELKNIVWCFGHLNKFSKIDRCRFDAKQGYSSDNRWMIGMRSRDVAKMLESNKDSQ